MSTNSIPRPQPIIHVTFKCPDFGVNSQGMRLSEWPAFVRRIGKRRIISAYVVGSLV